MYPESDLNQEHLASLTEVSVQRQAQLRATLERRNRRWRRLAFMAVLGLGFYTSGANAETHVSLVSNLAWKALLAGCLLGYLAERSIFGKPD